MVAEQLNTMQNSATSTLQWLQYDVKLQLQPVMKCLEQTIGGIQNRFGWITQLLVRLCISKPSNLCASSILPLGLYRPDQLFSLTACVTILWLLSRGPGGDDMCSD